MQNPWWGTVVRVDDVPVQLDQKWDEAFREAGPNTTFRSSIVDTVGNLYPPIGSGIVRASFVLVPLNPVAGDSYPRALHWAWQYNLPSASPRYVFALAKHKPNLHRELGMDPMFVVSPVEGGAHVCSVWFGGGRREAHVRWVGSISGHRDGWVAFLREPA